MNARVLLALLLTLTATLLPRSVHGQADEVDWDALFGMAEAVVQEDLDPRFVEALQGQDAAQTRQLLEELMRELENDYVLDLAQLREAARALLPMLESNEETLPYAIWLRPRLDYLDVAQDLKTKSPPPKGTPNQPVVSPPNPKPEVQEKIWVEKLAIRPWPKEASNYVHRLKPVFTKAGVPPELVWIAEVESSFDPRAVSPKGAAGLFQLMPATARRFGLRIWPFDQRLRPEAGAQAAAEYLRFLHGKFKDWPLAIAAYNCGEGRVQGLLNKQRARSFEAIAATLPAETQMYVPRVEATLRKREGMSLKKLPSARQLANSPTGK